MSTDTMRLNLRRFLLIVACIATAPAFAQRGALTVPRNLDQLTDRAADIVRGTVLSAHVEKHPELTNLDTVVVTLRVSETLKGQAIGTYTFRQYIWDVRDRYDNAGYRKGQELLLLMNEPSRYGLTSPVGIEQGRFRIHRDEQPHVGPERHRQPPAFRRIEHAGGQARRAHGTAGEPGRETSQWPGLARGADGHDPRLREQRLMRRHGSAFLFAAAGLIAAGLASAGGPLGVFTNGEPYVWNVATIQYRTDGGPLSATVTEQAARTRVQNMFNVWQNVGSASISYSRVGAILDVGAFTDGDVSTAVEYDAVNGACGSSAQNPVIYDVTGEIFEDVVADDSVIGFAGPCSIDPALGRILSGSAVMNGLYQDGQAAPIADLTAAEYDATFIHEFGHFSGLDHSQINVDCGFVNCGADNLAGLPTMFPFLMTSRRARYRSTTSAGSRSYTRRGAASRRPTARSRALIFFSGRRVARTARQRGRPARRRSVVRPTRAARRQAPASLATGSVSIRATRSTNRATSLPGRSAAWTSPILASSKFHCRPVTTRSKSNQSIPSSSRARASAATSASTCRGQRRCQAVPSPSRPAR